MAYGFNIRSFQGQNIIYYKPMLVLPQTFLPNYELKSIDNSFRSSYSNLIDTTLWETENENVEKKLDVSTFITTDSLLIEFFNHEFETICSNNKKITKMKEWVDDQSDIIMQSGKLPFMVTTFDQYILKKTEWSWFSK